MISRKIIPHLKSEKITNQIDEKSRIVPTLIHSPDNKSQYNTRNLKCRKSDESSTAANHIYE